MNKEQKLKERVDFLESLGRKFSTDKIDHHDYLRVYAEKLPEKCRSMMEIGAAHGSSCLMWNSFFGETELDLYVMDLYLDPNHVSPRWIRNNGWTPIVGDQSDINVLASIKEKFSVIVDDGSHNAHHQLISFKHLFFNNLVEGGQYYIEDCGCNLNEFYWGGYVEKVGDTPIKMFERFNKYGVIINPYFNEGESRIFEEMIASVEILSNDELILITRK